MFSVNKILVPTDFSENASAAYQPAQQIAARYDAQIDYMHVVPTSNYWRDSMTTLGVSMDVKEDVYPKMKKQASAKIKKLMSEHVRIENKGEHMVEVATKASVCIAECAEEGDYDLVVMAAKGHHESEFLSGSITKKIIRYSKVPVFSTEKSQLSDLQNILIPTDGSEASLSSLPVAVSLASVFEANITMYNALVAQRPLLDETPDQLIESKFKSVREDIFSKIESYLSHYKDEIELKESQEDVCEWVYHGGHSDVTIDIKAVVQSEVSKHNAIIDFAHKKADLVIMSTSGRSGIAHALIGSVAEVIAKEANRPVITVQTGSDTEDKENV